jgi:pimeloyl-ACP methyl ester carboxylesterase
MGKQFLLIHGAWHGGWCWDGVITELEKAGHKATALTLPGHHPDDDRSQIQFSDYVNKIIVALKEQSEPVIMVGHSSAGFLLQAAAPKVSDKVEGLIFLNAFILPNGKSQFDLVPPEVSKGMIAAAKASLDNCVPIMEEFIREVLMEAEPADLQDALISRLVPQPIALFTTPVDTRDFDQFSVPKAIVFCKKDASMPPGVYLEMAKSLGKYKLVELDGGHEALFTNAPVVAQGLLQAVE